MTTSGRSYVAHTPARERHRRMASHRHTRPGPAYVATTGKKTRIMNGRVLESTEPNGYLQGLERSKPIEQTGGQCGKTGVVQLPAVGTGQPQTREDIECWGKVKRRQDRVWQIQANLKFRGGTTMEGAWRSYVAFIQQSKSPAAVLRWLRRTLFETEVSLPWGKGETIGETRQMLRIHNYPKCTVAAIQTIRLCGYVCVNYVINRCKLNIDIYIVFGDDKGRLKRDTCRAGNSTKVTGGPALGAVSRLQYSTITAQYC